MFGKNPFPINYNESTEDLEGSEDRKFWLAKQQGLAYPGEMAEECVFELFLACTSPGDQVKHEASFQKSKEVQGVFSSLCKKEGVLVSREDEMATVHKIHACVPCRNK